ncbi:fasciclin domain-containing protein [Anditalea andensis]|uniref:FAS1 domain-containing protein n=1 Tax=Anditalea andensis TaxID=1048983 RepID=A0A074LIE1_9BACT|nr:fasciclin domain-containing protein [Anditalea andensis]KEO73542.1 hypothetical protein EL17_11615 [Anditalea andensis]
MKKYFNICLLFLFTAISGYTTFDPVNEKKSLPDENTLMDIAVQTEFLSTLVKALQAGELAGTLQEDGPFTLFAPSNGAFDKLPSGTLQELMQPGNRQRLKEILNHHIVPGKITAADLSDGQTLKSLGDSNLNVRNKGNQIMINGATITTLDIGASNGVIHIVDSLILSRR